MEKGLGKEMTRFGLSIIFGIFGVNTGRCADELWWFHCVCTVVFPAKRLEQMIVTSLYDVTRVSRAPVGGNYKRRA